MPEPNIVGIYKTKNSRYPQAPYSPSVFYPEYRFKDLAKDKNEVYEGVRHLFLQLGFDKKNFGKENWNPLGELINKGDTVVIKPNMVLDHGLDDRNDLEVLVTHGSVIRAVLDYVFLALNKTGKVIVCDAPHGDANWKGIIDFLKLKELKMLYEEFGYEMEYYDLRQVQYKLFNRNREFFYFEKLDGDPNGYRSIDLGTKSHFSNSGFDFNNIIGASLNRRELKSHHVDGKHEYLIAQSILNADVFISLPKLKSHKKTGVTLSLKNTIGISGNKNYLPHQMTCLNMPKGRRKKAIFYFNNFIYNRLLGEFGSKNICSARIALTAKDILVFLKRNAKKIIRKATGIDYSLETGTSWGDWHGNDVIWRTVLDLNKILFYSDKKGILRDNVTRKHLSIIDGIVAGEGEGPLSPERKEAGILIGGMDFVLVDSIACMLMGFGVDRIKLMKNASKMFGKTIEDASIVSNDERFHSLGSLGLNHFKFKAPNGWRGYLEV